MSGVVDDMLGKSSRVERRCTKTDGTLKIFPDL